MYRDQKPEGFFWLVHRTVDAKHNFIVDVHVTPGNVSDSTVYLDRFAYPLEAVALDAGPRSRRHSSSAAFSASSPGGGSVGRRG